MLVHPDADHAAHLAMRAGDRHPRARGQHHAEGGPQLDGKPSGEVYGGQVLPDGLDHVMTRDGEAKHDSRSAQNQNPDRRADVARILPKVEALDGRKRAGSVRDVVCSMGKALEGGRQNLQVHEDPFGPGQLLLPPAQEVGLLTLRDHDLGGLEALLLLLLLHLPRVRSGHHGLPLVLRGLASELQASHLNCRDAGLHLALHPRKQKELHETPDRDARPRRDRAHLPQREGGLLIQDEHHEDEDCRSSEDGKGDVGPPERRPGVQHRAPDRQVQQNRDGPCQNRGHEPGGDDLQQARPQPLDTKSVRRYNGHPEDSPHNRVRRGDRQSEEGGSQQEDGSARKRTHHPKLVQAHLRPLSLTIPAVLPLKVADFLGQGVRNPRAQGDRPHDLHHRSDQDRVLHGDGAAPDGSSKGVGDVICAETVREEGREDAAYPENPRGVRGDHTCRLAR
mmetsp:Transcript_2286/g.7683  ORF Transcript_2286/g.7683 Transcript_2286/m.7683 type:complete len:450 (+) Transcript_2286:172-1521(+)